MDPDRTLDRLLAADVLAADGSDELRLAEPFRAARADHLGGLSTADDDEIASALADLGAEHVTDPADRDERARTLATLRALADCDPDLAAETRVQLLPVLERFESDPPRDDGVPDSFTPVTGPQLVTMLRSSRRAIVYVWKDDCDPCDVMREEFDDMFPEPPEDIALLAVCGPEAMDAMAEFDVVGAPTTLFVSNGSVDIRLQGAQYRDLLDTEVENLRET